MSDGYLLISDTALAMFHVVVNLSVRMTKLLGSFVSEA